MGKAGPPSKPTALKVIEGNRGKQRLPQNEVKPSVSSICPDPPEWLSDCARDFWNRHALTLHRCGLLTDADTEEFAVLSDVYGQMRQWMDEIEAKGLWVEKTLSRGGPQEIPNPAVDKANELRTQFHRIASTFGMNPSSRSGLEVGKPRTADRLKESLG